MLQKVLKIKGFGVLDNHMTDKPMKPFNIYNLIYGWNGSGKTTFGRLLRSLEKKENHIEFSGADFVVESESSGKVESKTYNHNLEIKVFNQDFIKENLDLFDAQTKPIVFISKTKIDEKKLLDQHKIDLNASDLKLKKIVKDLDVSDKKADDFHKDAAKSIKDFFLGTIYATVSYNKNHSSAIWGKIKAGPEILESYVLTEQELTNQKNYTLIDSEKKEIDTASLPPLIDVEKIKTVYDAVNGLIGTNISAKVIDRLKDNPVIGEWVSTGLILHKQHNSEFCEFCGQSLPENCIENLEAHYNKEYQVIIDSITALTSKLEQGIRTEMTNESHLLFHNLKESYNISLAETNSDVQLVNAKIQELISILTAKKSNPFATPEKVIFEIEVFKNFNEKLKSLMIVMEEHNSTSKQYKDLAEKAKINIENHFVSQAAIEKDLKNIEQEIKDYTDLKQSETETSDKLKANIISLTDELSNDTLAIAEINENLHKFLGRNDIVLQRQEQGGYQLIRNGIVARNLSEGEKTAISLIYFFSKIQENNAEIKNQIIVLDDPISSFDSNHLFNASSFIKNSTNGAKQVFVLTHNFWFFKQVRDWMKSKNKKDRNDIMQIKSHFYSTKSGQITDADKTLSDTHSEYQFVFKSILEFQKAESLNPSDYFYIANSVRRLLEGFSSFKTASNSGMEGVFDLGRKYKFDQMQRDRIYYFVQKYSHLDRIESFDNTIEPLLEESLHVVNDVLTLIELVDNDHYKYMLKACEC